MRNHRDHPRGHLMKKTIAGLMNKMMNIELREVETRRISCFTL